METTINNRQEYIAPKTEIIEIEMESNLLLVGSPTGNFMEDPEMGTPIVKPGDNFWGN